MIAIGRISAVPGVRHFLSSLQSCRAREVPTPNLVKQQHERHMRIIAGTKIELRHVPDGIRLFVNDIVQPVRWRVYERKITGDITHRGGFIPPDKAWVFYVIGDDGYRYRYLYLLALPEGRFRIGTRADFGAVYTSNCYSHRQRKMAQECRLLRLTKRKREQRERRMARRAT